jgi:hypothetical protein
MTRIYQLYSKFGWHLKANLKKKYGLSEARDRKSPVLFHGIYGTQILDLLKWAETTKVLAWWSGSDVSYCFRGREHLIEVVRNHPNISHIATVNFIERDLQKFGFKYKKVPLFSQFIDDFKPCKLGSKIYAYKPRLYLDNPQRIKTLEQIFGEDEFIKAESHHTFSQAGIKEVYANSCLGLRFLRHDGLSHSVCEMGLMGRKMIYNGDTPNAIPFTNLDDVIETIKRVKEERYDPFEVARQMKDYLDVGENWLLVD